MHSVKSVQINGREVNLETGQIHHGDKTTQLPPRLLTLLNYLVDKGGQVLSRDEIIEAVWGHLDAATDDSVNVAVSALRRAIGDDRRPHRILKAIPRRGYLMEASAWEPKASARGAAYSQPGQPTAAVSPKQRYAGFQAGLLAVLLITAGLLIWNQPWQSEEGSREIDAGPPAVTGRAVAVLPFADMSVANNKGPFADGLVDRIIHMLTLSPELEVVARTSSFAFRDSAATIGEIGERLQVDAILEGSVQHSADTIRVLAQLIDARTEMHIWSRTYDRPSGELFELQDQIANEVARTMTNSLLPQSDTPHADSQRVWELITQGRFALDRFTTESAADAADYFRQALALQADNVEALVGLVDAIHLQRSFGNPPPGSETEDIAETYLARARQLAPESALVARATGDSHFRNGRSDEAIAAYKQATSINPNDAVAFRQLGRAYFRLQRFDDAIEPLRTAVRLDPFSGLGSVWLADAFWSVGRAEEALARLRQIIEDQPDFAQAHDRIATYLTQTGESGQAMRHIIRAHELDPESSGRWFRMCEFWLHLADVESAEQCAKELLAEHDMPFLGRYLRQIIHGFRGEWDAMERELEAIYAMGRRDPLTRTLLAQSYSRDKCPQAMAVLTDSFPSLFENPPDLNPSHMMAAKTAIHCMHQAGEHEQAAPLLEVFADWVERTRIDRGPWMIVGIEPAWVHALKGDYEAALAFMEELVEDDWRYYWWGLDGYYPEFEPLLNDPRWQAMIRRLEEGVRQQRQYFEAHRDEPLS